MSRYHDPDEDYAFDPTNRPDPKPLSEWRKEMIAKAGKCLSYERQEFNDEYCRTCQGPKFAHSVHALRKKAS